MARENTRFLDRLRDELLAAAAPDPGHDQRHPARASPEYEQLKWHAAQDIDEMCDRVVADIRSSLDEIEKVVGPIAAPMADQLARGAVSDIFEAAAQVIKSDIRRDDEKGT